MDIDKAVQLFDSTFGSCSRPTIAIICGIAVAASCFFKETAQLGVGSCTAIVMAYITARGIENVKKTNADASVNIAAQSGTTSTVEAKSP